MWPTDNLDSWRRIREFIAEFPDDDRWRDWKRIASALIDSLAAERLDCAFRVGQSVSHLIFSTLGHHQLTDEPRVTLEIDYEARRVTVSNSQSNVWFNPPIEQETVTETDALLSTKRALRRLWCATKPESELPVALREV